MSKDNIKRAILRVEEIVNEIIQNPSENVGLFGGLGGQILFLLEYSKQNKKNIDSIFSVYVQSIVDKSIYCNDASFANGMSGINWLYTTLLSQDLIEQDDFDNISYDIQRLIEISLHETQRKNWDFLHGSLGVLYSVLAVSSTEYNHYFISFIYKLQLLIGKELQIDIEGSSPLEINLGLAHGITSILKFCIQCFKKNICPNESELLANKIINFLINNKNSVVDNSYFPYMTDILGESKNNKSRLAWCYGDLTIGFIMYQYSTVFKKDEVLKFSLEILKHNARRKGQDDTNIFDAGICHGSAGVAHIFNKMWHCTKETIFKEAAEYWIQKTLNFAYHRDGAAGYKKYNPTNDTWQIDFGLLEGSAGIGLVLLSYLKGDFSWDYCLMLNDYKC